MRKKGKGLSENMDMYSAQNIVYALQNKLNKLASLEATLVQNYDLPTQSDSQE